MRLAWRGVQTIEAGAAGVGARKGGERAMMLDLVATRGRRREGATRLAMEEREGGA
jgi:hypothetical protein